MIKFIYGSAASGKSGYAQELIEGDSKGRGLVYLATMTRSGSESRKKIERHLKLREGRGYVTLECERGLPSVFESLSPFSYVLLEDVTNLVANELFAPDSGIREVIFPDTEKSADEWQSADEEQSVDEGQPADPKKEGPSDMHGRYSPAEYADRMASRILKDILELSKRVKELVVVSGEVFLDGYIYDREVDLYLRVLAEVNYGIAHHSELFTEVVCGRSGFSRQV